MTKERFSKAFFMVVLLFLLIEAGYLLSPFFGPLLCAVMTAIVCFPLHKKWRTHFKKISPSFQALLSDLVIFLFLMVPATLLIITMINEIQTSLPTLVTKAHSVVHTAQTIASGSSPNHRWLDRVQPYASTIRSKLSSIGERVMGSLANMATDAAKNVFGFLVSSVIFLIVLFFLFKDGEELYRQWNELIPLSESLKHRIHERIRYTVEGVVRSAVVIGLVQGFVLLIGFLIVSFPAAVLFGCLSACASLLPGIGSGIIWIPLAIYYAVSGVLWKGVVLVAFGIFTGVIDGFIRPYIVGRNADMPFLWLMFAVLGGLEIFGAKGLILGPLVFGLLPVFLDIYRGFLHDRTSNL